MPLVDPYAEIAAGIKLIIDGEFAAEGYTAMHDRLHESVGYEGTRIGISPEDQIPQRGNELVLDTRVLVQFYGKFDLEVDNNQKVDPRTVTGYAARFRHALYSSAAQGTNGLWYFKLDSITYPRDPTGNKSRFEALVLAKGDNAGLVETIG